MTTITLDSPKIETKYNAYEIKMLFMDFLENNLKEDKVELYEDSVSDLPLSVLESYKNMQNTNFIKR